MQQPSRTVTTCAILLLGLSAVASASTDARRQRKRARSRARSRAIDIPPSSPVGELIHFDSSSCESPRCRARFAFGGGLTAASEVAACGKTTLQCDHVYDAHCGHEFRDAFFHRIVDCLLPSFSVIDHFASALETDRQSSESTGGNTTTVCLILHSASYGRQSYESVVIPFLPARSSAATIKRLIWDSSWPGHDRDGHPQKGAPSCFRMNANAKVTTWTQSSTTFKRRGCGVTESANLGRMSDRLGLAHASGEKDFLTHPKLIVWIQRQSDSDRSFRNFSAILRHFRRGVSNSNVVVYSGNESFHSTARLFASADVVIGYHGAGLVNALFLPKRALVIEITTTRDPQRVGTWLDDDLRPQLRVWRTNRMLAGCRELDWRVYALPHSQLGVTKKVLKRNDLNGVSLHQFLKKTSTVDLTAADLDQIAHMVALHHHVP